MSAKPTNQQQIEESPAVVTTSAASSSVVSRVPASEVRCGACDEVLVSIARTATAEAILQVYERQVLRPHTLTDEDLPLNWRCPKCGAPTTIGAAAAEE